MVVPELHFFDVELVVVFIDAMIFLESFLGKAPEPFQSVDIIVPFPEGFLVVDLVVFAILLQALIALEAIGIVD